MSKLTETEYRQLFRKKEAFRFFQVIGQKIGLRGRQAVRKSIDDWFEAETVFCSLKYCPGSVAQWIGRLLILFDATLAKRF